MSSKPPRARRGAALATATALAALTAGQAVAAAAPGGHATPQPGSAGIGDPYFPLSGNGGIDVRHYGLRLRYQPPADPDADVLHGVLHARATLRLRATQDLSRFHLDLRGLHVRKVTVNGERAAFRRHGGELVVIPATPLRKGQRAVVVVRYGGRTGQPTDLEDTPYGWYTTADGAMVANEPDGAPTWFPSNDHPRDKATFRFRITVPKGYVAVANGLLARRHTAHGRTTWVWRAPDPMATYLATASVGEYHLTRSTGPHGLPIIDAVDDDVRPGAADALSRQADIIAFFETRFGRYPFVAVGGIVDDDTVGYALETQTRPIYSRTAKLSTVAHELAHQWFGDAVSPHRWADIWLNEGWASYGSWLWQEHDGGDRVQAQYDAVMATPADEAVWQTPVADPGPTGLFSDAVYDRGAATLHALRVEIGDRAFFRLARTWVRTHAGGTGTTEQFQALAEKVSGQQLDRFFDAWVHSTGKPTDW